MKLGTSCRVGGDQNKYFKPRHDGFPELNKYILVSKPNQTKSKFTTT